MSQPTEPTTITGAATAISTTVVRSLTPQFLALILINVIFMSVFVWFLNSRTAYVAVLLKQIFDSCLQHK